MEAKEEGIIVEQAELKAIKFTKDHGWLISFEVGECEGAIMAALQTLHGRLLNIHVEESGLG